MRLWSVPASLAAALVVSYGGPALVAQADTYPRVLTNVMVNTDTKDFVRDHSIPETLVDPDNPEHVFVVDSDFRIANCFLYGSTDGGLTWTEAKKSPLPPQFDHCAPNSGTKSFPMAWAQDGSLLVMLQLSVGNEQPEDQGSVALARTSDFGNSWSTVLVKDQRNLPGGGKGAGIWQTHMSSDRKGHVVVGWRAEGITIPGRKSTENRPFISISNDDGKTFGSPIDVTGGNDPGYSVRRGPAVAIAPDGTVFALYQMNKPAKDAPADVQALTPSLVVARTSDGGKTFQRSFLRAVTDFTSYPEIAVAPAGSGYVVDVVSEELADGDAGVQGVRDIASQRSTDGGKTWSPKVRVTDDNLSADLAGKFVPGISAAPDGRLDVAWYDFRNDDGHLLSDVYYSYSTDGAASWAPNIRVSDRSSNRHFGEFANYADVRGPVSISSDQYSAYMVWNDSRNATADKPVEDAYFASVQQHPLPVTSGFRALRFVAAAVGGLLAAAIVLFAGSLVVRRRRLAPAAAH